MNFDIMHFFSNIVLIFFPFLFALCFHEYAHGLMAKFKGDNTAEIMGRLTLNPIPHMDVVGTFILPLMSVASITVGSPAFFFGWAKPVPISVRNLKNPKNDLFWIALAGPMSNIFLGIIAAFLFFLGLSFLGPQYHDTVKKLTMSFLITNVSLAVFNMIPIHPLDGGKVLARFLPAKISYMLEQYEHVSGLILMFIFLSGLGSLISYPVRIVAALLLNLAQWVVG